jgi:MFS family permease
MTIAGSALEGLSELDHRAQLRRAVIASTVGTTIEWYDFFIYGTVTGLVFPKLYFPGPARRHVAGVRHLRRRLCPAAGWGGDLRALRRPHRPQGGIDRDASFDGDRDVPRRLCADLRADRNLGCGHPDVLRFVQGVGVGGEWGGSVLLSMEWARTTAHRGFIASWPQFGVPSGLFLANFAALAMSEIAGDQFLSWGWRVPFFISIVLVGIGLYIRLGILETPIFAKLAAENRLERAPMIEAFRRQPREIALSALARMSEQAPFYIFTAFVFSYGTGVLHSTRDFLLTAVLAASFVSFFSIPIAGHLSDRIGRKRMYLIGVATVGVFGFVYFALLDTMVPGLIFLAIVLSLIPHDMQYGPQAALIAECFTPRLRYSGASLGYQFASIIAGGPAPLIATALFAAYHSGYAIALYILACAVISFIATALLPDYTNRDVSREYDGV